MPCKGSHKQPQKLSYGATRGKYWCKGCDRDLVPDWNDKPKKKQARQKAKKEIRKELKNYE